MFLVKREVKVETGSVSGVTPASAGLVARVKTDQPQLPEIEEDVADVTMGEEPQVERITSEEKATTLFDLDFSEEVARGEMIDALTKENETC